MINKVILVGRLTRDPEINETEDRGKVVSMRVVTSEYLKGEDGSDEDVQYHSVVVFGHLAVTCAVGLHKGGLAYFEGRLRTREWEGKDGLHRYTTEVVADYMKMLSSVSADVRSGQ